MKVTTDNLTGNTWHYHNGWYTQKDADGNEVSRLSAGNFPDPNVLWEAKINKSGALTEQQRNARKPRQYIFDIWDHIQQLEV